MKQAYLKVVDKPMDFRTIEEDEIQAYGDIAELQDDLILIYKNCVSFNGAQNDYGKYAM